MYFASDNWAGAHPKIAASLVEQAGGYAPAYGASELDGRVEARFSEIFERQVAVFFVGTGTAANALAYTAFAKPGGVLFAHREAHMVEDECGAPEYLTGGGRICPVDGPIGRIDAADLSARMEHFSPGSVHAGQPAAISVTQASEYGTLYSLAALDAIAAIADAHRLPLHMDGARFANALVSLGVSPAEMTWKRGVDVLSFGGTKNGCWCAEAVVFFDPAQAEAFPYLRKRAAQLFSKSRFVAAQFDAYLRDDLWLETARHANTMATRLAGHIEAGTGARLAWQPQANELFPIIRRDRIARAAAEGAVFKEWKPPHGLDPRIGADEAMCRLVTSFATTAEDVDRLGELLA